MNMDNVPGTDSSRVVECGLRLLGVRDLEPQASEALRVRTLPTVLSLLMAEPAVQIRFDYEANENGIISIRVISSAAELAMAKEMRKALGRLISPIGDIEPYESSMTDQQAGRCWALAHKGRSASPGFAPQGQLSPVTMIAEGFPYSTISDLLEALVHAPGFRVSASFSSRQQDARQALPDLDVKISVQTVGRHEQPLPLAITAVINRLVPGGRLERGEHHLPMSFSDAGSLPLIPASSKPLPGLDTAPAASVPVRHHPGLGQPESGVDLGQAYSFTGNQIRAALTIEEQVRHLHVTGRTGTGKSTLLATMAHSIAALGQGLLVLDPHGTLVDRIAAELPEAALHRTLLIRAADVEHPVPLNPLATEDPVKRDLAISDILEGFYAMFDPGRTGIVGPRFEQTVGMCLRTLAAYKGARASILDVPRLLTDIPFQHRARLSVTDPAIQGFWSNHELAARSNDHGELISWITSKWERFTTTAALRAILETGEDALNFEAAMEHHQIILLDLSKGAIGEAAASLLGFLYTTRIWTAALNRAETRPFTVMVDEAHTLMAGALPAMLSEGRKYGLSIVIAHQFLGQLSPELSQALAGNTATQVAFRAGRSDAEALHHRMGRAQSPETYTNLPDLSALVQRTAGPTTAHPHTITVMHRSRDSTEDVKQRLASLEETTTGLLSPPDSRYEEPMGAPANAGNVLGAPADPPKIDKAASFLDRWLENQKQQTAKTRIVSRSDGGEKEPAQDQE